MLHFRTSLGIDIDSSSPGNGWRSDSRVSADQNSAGIVFLDLDVEIFLEEGLELGNGCFEVWLVDEEVEEGLQVDPDVAAVRVPELDAVVFHWVVRGRDNDPQCLRIDKLAQIPHAKPAPKTDLKIREIHLTYLIAFASFLYPAVP